VGEHSIGGNTKGVDMRAVARGAGDTEAGGEVVHGREITNHWLSVAAAWRQYQLGLSDIKSYAVYLAQYQIYRNYGVSK